MAEKSVMNRQQERPRRGILNNTGTKRACRTVFSHHGLRGISNNIVTKLMQSRNSVLANIKKRKGELIWQKQHR